jgi:hypothetical protein
MTQCSTIRDTIVKQFEIIFRRAKMNDQPEALRLAAALDAQDFYHDREAAAELRRLHEVNQVMLNALKWIADQTYDPWTNGAEAQRHALNAIAKATTE